MTWENNGKAAMETFSIETQGFKLYAMLITIKDGRSLIHGWTKFDDSEKSRFFSADKDKRKLRNRLLSACIPIANFYGVELMREKIQPPGEGKHAYPLMTNISRVLQ
jgi:hypothetical protein